MVTTKNLFITRLYLVLLIILNHVSALAQARNIDVIYVTDFKYYRKFDYKDQQLLLFKDSNIKSIYYLSDKFETTFTKNNDKAIYNFKMDTRLMNYKLAFADNKATFSLKRKSTYFFDASTSICEKALGEKVLNLKAREYIRGIKASTIASLTDSTCDENQKEKIGEVFQNMLESEKAWLTKCYSNSSVNKLIKADPNYLGYTMSVYSKYLNLAKKLGEGQQPLQISCKINTSGKLGLFDETSVPEKISLDWDTLSKNITTQNRFEDKIKQTLGHELFHYGEQMQTPQDKPASQCINESYARIFTDVCLQTENDTDQSKSKTIIIPTSEKVATSCEKKIITSVDFDSDKNVKKGYSESKTADYGGLSAEDKERLRQEQANQNTQNAVQANLNNGKNKVTQADFNQVSNSDFETLASNTTPNVQTGKPYSVAANSSFGQTVQKTLNSFANSGNTLTTKLNSAVAAATTTAQASTTTLASTNTATTQNSTTYVKDASHNTSTETTNGESSTSYSPTTTIARVPANIDNSASSSSGASSKQTSEHPNSASEMAGGSNATSGAQGMAAKTSPISGSAASLPGGETMSNSSNSSTNPKPVAKKETQKANTGSDIVKTIQSLKAFNTVTGSQYQEVKKLYKNSQFQNLLQTYDMRIMVKNANGQYEAIGVDGKKAKRVFNDDGQVLKTVEDKK